MAKKEAAEKAAAKREADIERFWENVGQMIWLGKDTVCLAPQFTTEDGRTILEVLGFVFHRPAIKRGSQYFQTTYIVRVKQYNEPTVGAAVAHISGWEREVSTDSDYESVSPFSYGTERFKSAKELVYTLWFR